MATENKYFTTTIAAGADYSGAGEQYHAFALADGQLAANSRETTGILLNKPASGQFAEVGYFGEMKFAAGGAISKGGKIKVTTSGWFVGATSYEMVVGEAKADVTSGSIGTGFFQFASVAEPSEALTLSVTPKVDLLSGTAIAFNDLLQADTGKEAGGVLAEAGTSGTATSVVIWGKVHVKCDPAKVCSMGDLLTVTTSGYFIPCGSGYYSCGRALENIGSNATGDAIFYGVAQGYNHP